MMKFMLVLMLLMVAFSKWWLIPLAFVIWKILPNMNISGWFFNNDKIDMKELRGKIINKAAEFNNKCR